jgi:hypothetical protein
MSLCCSALGHKQPRSKSLALHAGKKMPSSSSMPAVPDPGMAAAALFESYALFGAEPGAWLSLKQLSDEADAAPELRNVDVATLGELFESYGIFGSGSALERHIEVAERQCETSHAAAADSVQFQELFESYGVFSASWTSVPQRAADVEAAHVSRTLFRQPELSEAAALAFVEEKEQSDAASTACTSEHDISDPDSDAEKADC